MDWLTRKTRTNCSSLLDARQPTAVQLAVLQALSGLLDPGTARQIILHWKSMSPAVRREAVEVFFGRDDGDQRRDVRRDQSRAMTASELDPARSARLREHPDVAIRARAKISAETASRDRGPSHRVLPARHSP